MRTTISLVLSLFLAAAAFGACTTQLAFGDDIGTGTEASEKAQNGKVRVGFDCVANERSLCRKGLGEPPILRSEGGC